MIWQDWLLSSLYIVGLAGPPVSLGFAWWAGPIELDSNIPNGARWFFLSGLLEHFQFRVVMGLVSGSRFHFTTESWRVRDPVSNVGIWLLFYSIVAAIAGKGRYRVLIALSGVFAILPWIPVGVL